MYFDININSDKLEFLACYMQESGFIWKEGFHLKIESHGDGLRVRVEPKIGKNWYIFIPEHYATNKIPRMKLWRALQEVAPIPTAFDKTWLEHEDAKSDKKMIGRTVCAFLFLTC